MLSQAMPTRSTQRPVARNTKPRKREGYAHLLGRLSRQSVKKHFDAYVDVDWDAHTVDPADARWEYADHPLTKVEWFREQSPEKRAEICLAGVVGMMKIGVQFENILSRGLLQFANRCPNGSPEYRYAMHEIIEEGQHSLMFQEFVNRSGMDPKGISGWMRVTAELVPGLGATFPELFFLFVLGGEAPIDYEQKRFLKHTKNPPPLLKRITQIHVTEEARHLCFAKRYLEENYPKLPLAKKIAVGVVTPFMLATMANLMLRPEAIRARVPGSIVNEAYKKNPEYAERVRESIAPIRKLCESLGIVNRSNVWLWRSLGLAGELGRA